MIRIPCVIESPYAAPLHIREAVRQAERSRIMGRITVEMYRAAKQAQLDAEQTNRDYLRAVARHLFAKGYAPFASHAIYPAWLDDNNRPERQLGIDAGLALVDALFVSGSTLCVFIGADLGVSEGMAYALNHHAHKGRKVQEIFLGDNWRSLINAPCAE